MATINEQKIAVQNPVELAQHSNPNSVAQNKTKQEAREHPTHNSFLGPGTLRPG